MLRVKIRDEGSIQRKMTWMTQSFPPVTRKVNAVSIR